MNIRAKPMPGAGRIELPRITPEGEYGVTIGQSKTKENDPDQEDAADEGGPMAQKTPPSPLVGAETGGSRSLESAFAINASWTIWLIWMAWIPQFVRFNHI